MLAIIILAQPAIVEPIEHACHQESPPLGDDRSERHTFYRHPADEDEHQRGYDVHHILRERYHHRNARVLHTDIPARESIESEHGGSSPDADIAVSASQLHDIRLWRHRPQSASDNPSLKDKEEESYPHANAQGANQESHHLGKISPAQCLRSHSAGSHPQESEQPVDDIEEHRSHGNGSDIRCIADMSDDGDIYQTQKRYRDIGYYRRYR